MSGVALSPVAAAPVLILSEGLGQRKPPFLVSALAGGRGVVMGSLTLPVSLCCLRES